MVYGGFVWNIKDCECIINFLVGYLRRELGKFDFCDLFVCFVRNFED